ncbi:MAG: hypothetical protein ACXU82_02720 [Caulobacteraceae bacterium]
MKHALVLSFGLLTVLCACGRNEGIYADRSATVIAPTASAETAPRFVGRWAASAAQCGDPLVFAARSLTSGAANCTFDKVDPSTAGYAITAICRSESGPKPSRLIVTTPNEPRISLLTVSGGPFKDATALQRCPGA